MKTHVALLLLIIVALGGCAGSPARLATMSSQQLQVQNDGLLCAAYGAVHSKKIRTEIERRGLLTAAEWALVDSKSIAIGMSELAMVASVGAPNPVYGSVTETVTAGGVSKQFVYRNSDYVAPTCYVYTVNGKVTAYQK